jgi:hypothetical protein
MGAKQPKPLWRNGNSSWVGGFTRKINLNSDLELGKVEAVAY